MERRASNYSVRDYVTTVCVVLLRLTTPVNAAEKQRAVREAREAKISVPELIRQLLAERHAARRKKAAAKKVRDAKKTGATRSRFVNSAALATKPSRTVGTRKRATNSTARRAPKKSLKSRVVSPTRKSSKTARRRTKPSAAMDSSPILG